MCFFLYTSYNEDVDILKNIEIAKVAARLAGKNLKDNYNSLNITQLEEGRDIKLKADLELQLETF